MGYISCVTTSSILVCLSKKCSQNAEILGKLHCISLHTPIISNIKFPLLSCFFLLYFMCLLLNMSTGFCSSGAWSAEGGAVLRTGAL
jgi:hypothetical protein